MSISIPQTAIRPSVRMPFRILAALIGIIGTIALLGASFLVWRGDRVPTIGDIVMLPGMAWFMRLAFYAAANGKAPTNENWPFASRGGWNFYLFSMLAYQIFKP